MRKLSTLFGLLLILLTSCQKESSDDQPAGPSNNNSMLGTWKFIGMQAQTQVIVTASDLSVTEKSVTTSEYTTTENKGTIKVEESKMSGIGLSYLAEAQVKAYFYQNNVLLDSAEAPMSFQMPVTNSSATYKRIGADSIHFEAGGLMDIQGSPTQATKPIGYRYKVEGDKLFLFTNYVDAKVQTINGVSAQVKYYANIKSSFQKQ